MSKCFYSRPKYGDYRIWVWEFLQGPANIIDGITWTLALGRAGTTLAPLVSHKIIKAKMVYYNERKNNER